MEATFASINTLFCQHVAAYAGSNTTLRGLDATGAWTLPELQDLFDEWLLIGWQARPHDALRDPLLPRRALSPNEMYTALVAAAGYLPLTLSGDDYLELLPVEWRQINVYGIRIGYRTYDCPQLAFSPPGVDDREANRSMARRIRYERANEIRLVRPYPGAVPGRRRGLPGP